jgi:3-hydroxy acid dehydrogenase/malonic semialdehyde reductase
MTKSTARVALITGGTSGIGAATARRFAADGWHLVLTGRREDRLEAMRASLDAPVHTILADVADREAMERALAALPAPFDAVEVLVNNAGHGVGTDVRFQDADLDELRRLVDDNINGVVATTRLLLPGMIARGRGHVFTIGSVFHRYPHPMSHVYAACKTFLENFIQAIRADLLETGVRCTTIEPGLVGTEFVERRFKGDAEKIAGRVGGVATLAPEDVADCIHFCVSLPQRATVTRLELMMTDQAPGPMQMVRSR